MAAGIDNVALVEYGRAALETMRDVPYSPNGCVRRYDIGCTVPTEEICLFGLEDNDTGKVFTLFKVPNLFIILGVSHAGTVGRSVRIC